MTEVIESSYESGTANKSLQLEQGSIASFAREWTMENNQLVNTCGRTRLGIHD